MKAQFAGSVSWLEFHILNDEGPKGSNPVEIPLWSQTHHVAASSCGLLFPWDYFMLFFIFLPTENKLRKYFWKHVWLCSAKNKSEPCMNSVLVLRVGACSKVSTCCFPSGLEMITSWNAFDAPSCILCNRWKKQFQENNVFVFIDGRVSNCFPLWIINLSS